MREYPIRKTNRLKNYDYSQNGAYFITMCIEDRHEILGKIISVGGGVPDAPHDIPNAPKENVGGGVPNAPQIVPDAPQIVPNAPYCLLSEIGKIVETQIKTMANFYTNTHIDKYIIMPNHIHLIISIDCQNKMYEIPANGMANRTLNGLSEAPTNGTLRTPSPANAVIPRFISTLKRYTNKMCGASIWQRSYHDIIIRNEAAYQKIWEYIDTNPLKWKSDRFYIAKK